MSDAPIGLSAKGSCGIAQATQQIRDCRLVHSGSRGGVGVRVMWRQQTLVQLTQRTVGRQRFYLEDVEARSGEGPLLQRDYQCVLIDYRAPSSVDENSSAAKEAKLLLADEMERRWIEIAVKRDEV